jgi:hypothetical protein
MLDVCDFGTNPKAPEFGGFGVLRVRYGKATKGSAPKTPQRAHGHAVVVRSGQGVGRVYPPAV